MNSNRYFLKGRTLHNTSDCDPKAVERHELADLPLVEVLARVFWQPGITLHSRCQRCSWPEKESVLLHSRSDLDEESARAQQFFLQPRAIGKQVDADEFRSHYNRFAFALNEFNLCPWYRIFRARKLYHADLVCARGGNKNTEPTLLPAYSFSRWTSVVAALWLTGVRPAQVCASCVDFTTHQPARPPQRTLNYWSEAMLERAQATARTFRIEVDADPLKYSYTSTEVL